MANRTVREHDWLVEGDLITKEVTEAAKFWKEKMLWKMQQQWKMRTKEFASWFFYLFSVCFRGSDRVSIHPGNDIRSDSENKGPGRPVAVLGDIAWPSPWAEHPPIPYDASYVGYGKRTRKKTKKERSKKKES